MTLVIESRSIREVNTDPQRRCYNGCHFSSELVWSQWEDLDITTGEKAEDRLAFWRDLNAYAVSQRGKSAQREYRIKQLNKGE
jgi:hypothetical protein